MDELVQLLDEVGFRLGLYRRELDHLGDGRVDLEGLEPVEIPAVAEQPERPEVGTPVAQGESQVILLVDPGVDDVRVLLEDGQPGAAEIDPDGQALGELLPGRSPVGRLVEIVARLAVDVRPGPPEGLIGGGDDNIRVAGVDDEIRHSPVLDGEDVGPGLPPVDRLEQAPLGFRPVVIKLAFGRDVDEVRILGVDGDLRDIIALFQAGPGPGLSGVGGLPDAVAVGAGAGVHGLPCAEIEDVGIGRRDRQIAHAHVAVLVENGLERDSRVLGFPEAAAGRENVVGDGLAAGHGEFGDPAREIDRTDPAPGELVEVIGRERDRALGPGQAGGRQQDGQNQDAELHCPKTGDHTSSFL